VYGETQLNFWAPAACAVIDPPPLLVRMSQVLLFDTPVPGRFVRNQPASWRAILLRDSTVSEGTRMSAALRLMPAVRGLGMATQKRPAALADAMPLGESSRATASWGSTPRRETARAYNSGSGLTSATSSRVQRVWK